MAKPTEATTTNTAPSPASFFTLTEHNCANERDAEKEKRKVKDGAFIIPILHFPWISPSLQHTRVQVFIRQRLWNEGLVALWITPMIDKRRGNKEINSFSFTVLVEKTACLVSRLHEWHKSRPSMCVFSKMSSSTDIYWEKEGCENVLNSVGKKGCWFLRLCSKSKAQWQRKYESWDNAFNCSSTLGTAPPVGYCW